MALNLGVHVKEQATSVSTPVLADVGVPYVVGAAPVFSASKPSKTGVPVLCTSWDEAVEKLGFSYDWVHYPLCEFMYSHFKLYGCQPVIFCNVFDPMTMHTGAVVSHFSLDGDGVATLPTGAILSTLMVVRPGVEVGDQTMKVRLNGPSKSGKEFDYAEAYKKAGVELRDGGIFFTPGGDLDEELAHDGDNKNYFFGITLPKPDGATRVTSKINGEVVDDNLDLSKEGAFVLNGEYTTYFAFADQDGQPMPTATWKIELTWTVGSDTKVTTCTVCRGMGNHCVEGDDYSAWYDEDTGTAYIQRERDGVLSDENSLVCEVDAAAPEKVALTDIVRGLDAIDACLSKAGVIPDLICAPGWSHNTVVAALMATKAEAGINGLFRAKALIDCDSGENGIHEYSELIEYKNRNNFVDENEILCWPMVKLGDYKFHMSTQLAGLMAQIDSGNGGVPFESPSNKNFQMDCCCLEDGTEVDLTFNQTVVLAGYGIVTALNFMSMGWVARNNYTACYPANTDVKDQFIPVSRMFDFVANTLIRTFWSKLDKPMRLRLLDNIQDTVNIWLNGLVSQEYLLGARVELKGTENPLTNLLSGIITFHIYITPPVPAQEIEFVLEYDVDYLTNAFQMAA